MLPPLPRRSGWVPTLLNPPVVSTFPERVTGSVCASTFSRLARRSLALRPAHSRCHQFVTCISRRLQPFRYLHSCSGSFRLEHLPGGPFTHWTTPPFHGAHPEPPLASGSFRAHQLRKQGVSARLLRQLHLAQERLITGVRCEILEERVVHYCRERPTQYVGNVNPCKCRSEKGGSSVD